MSLLNRLQARWQALSTREQRLASIAATVVLLACIGGIHDWQQRERLRLKAAVPAAEHRLHVMRKLADEFQQYAAKGQRGTSGPASAEAVLGALKAKGLALETGAAAGGQLAIKGQVAFDKWVDVLATLPSQGWRIERATVQPSADRTASAGFAQVDAVLVAAN